MLADTMIDSWLNISPHMLFEDKCVDADPLMSEPELVSRTGCVGYVCVMTAAAAGSVYTDYKISFTLRQTVCLLLSYMKDLHINLSVCCLSVSQLEECTLQLSPHGNYLDLDSSLAEQRDELESFYEDLT